MTKTFIILIFFLSNIIITNANILVLNGLTHKYKTAKGMVYKGKIELQNIGKSPKNVKLYLQDMTYSADGVTNYTAPGSNSHSNSNWIKFNTNLVEVKPDEKVDVLYEIMIPDYVTNEGSYWTTCMVEPVEDIVPNASSTGIQVRSIIRYAIQIIADFSTQTIQPELSFRNINIDIQKDNRLLKIELSNNGKIYCETTVSLEIYDTTNNVKIEGIYSSPTMGLLPSTSKSYNINISSLKPNKYKAIAFAKDEQDNVFALEFELDVK